jgi:membrane protease YdiL (CAAX protease family)
LEPQNTNRVTTFEAILVIIATFFAFLLVSGAIYLLVSEAVALVVGELIILLVPLSFLLLKRINIKTYVGIEVKPKFVLVGLVSIFGLLILNIAVTILLTSLFGVSEAVEQSNTLILEVSAMPGGIVLIATSLALAGFCEEFAFRGFLQNTLNRNYSFIPAVLVSALVFGLFHFDPQLVYILAAFTSGLALGLIYHKWNYVTAAIAHAGMNLVVLALLLYGF